MSELPEIDPYPNGEPESIVMVEELDQAIRDVLAKHNHPDMPAHLSGWVLCIYAEVPGGHHWQGAYKPRGQLAPFTDGLLLSEGFSRIV